jgi:hypothetical protein
LNPLRQPAARLEDTMDALRPVEAAMNFNDSLEAPSTWGGLRYLADAAAARGRLRASRQGAAWTGPCTVVVFPRGPAAGDCAPAAGRVGRSGLPRTDRRRGRVLVLLPALSAVLCGWQSQAPDPTDDQLIAVIRQYGAGLPHPTDTVTGRAVRVERTRREWVVTLSDPRHLDESRRHYVRGGRSAYHVDRSTLGVAAVAAAG